MTTLCRKIQLHCLLPAILGVRAQRHSSVKKGCSHVLRSRVSDCCRLLVGLKGLIGRKCPSGRQGKPRASLATCAKCCTKPVYANWTGRMIFVCWDVLAMGILPHKARPRPLFRPCVHVMQFIQQVSVLYFTLDSVRQDLQCLLLFTLQSPKRPNYSNHLCGSVLYINKAQSSCWLVSLSPDNEQKHNVALV